jgi:hypothetical protein
MSISLMPNPVMQFFGNDGNPLSGGYLYTYVAGRPGYTKTTYSDNSGLTQNTNPIILDSAGRANVWIDGYYSMELWTGDRTSGTSTMVWSQDNVSVIGGTFSGGYDVVVVQADPLATALVNVAGGSTSDGGYTLKTVTLPVDGRVTVIKTDATDGPVSILSYAGNTFADGCDHTLTGENEAITFQVSGTVYYEI